MTNNDVATQLDQAFEVAERDDGSDFTRLKDGSPEWMKDLVYQVHKDLQMGLPDDYVYHWVAMTASIASDEHDCDEMFWENPQCFTVDLADGMLSIGSNELERWMSSHPSRPNYVNQYGAPNPDETFDVHVSMRQGQFYEILAVVQSTLRGIMEQTEEQNDEDE